MVHQLLVAAVYGVIGLFFLGLAGCAFVVVFSWIDILRDGLTADTEA